MRRFMGKLALVMLVTGLGTASASADILDGATPTWVVNYDFSSRTAGTNWADGIMWGDSGAGSLATIYDDVGNLCGRVTPKTTTGSVYQGVFLNQSLLGVMANEPIHVLSFKAKLQSGFGWANWDKPVLVNWSAGGSGDYAYGTDIGTGFSLGTENGAGAAMGSFGYGSTRVGGNPPYPGHAYTTGSTTFGGPGKAAFDNTAWTTLTLAWDRTTGQMEWYQDGALYASYQILPTDANYAEWAWGSNVPIDPSDPRAMQWISVGSWGRFQSTTSSMLLDDFKVGYLPEPASLVLFGLAVGFVCRRSRA